MVCGKRKAIDCGDGIVSGRSGTVSDWNGIISAGDKVEFHQDVGLRVAAEGEGVAGKGGEAVFLVELQGAAVVFPHAEPEVGGALLFGIMTRLPVECGTNAPAVVGAEDVDALDFQRLRVLRLALCRAGVGFEVAEGVAVVVFGKVEAAFGVHEFLREARGREVVFEIVRHVGFAIISGEGFVEGGATDALQLVEVGEGQLADVHGCLGLGD